MRWILPFFLIVVAACGPVSCGMSAARQLVIPPSLPAPESERLPAGASLGEQAAFYRKLAARATAEAQNLEAAATREKQERQAFWCDVVGFGLLALAAAAFVLSYAYPLAAFLRIGAWAAGAVGAVTLLAGQVLPYLPWIAAIAVVAIVLSLWFKPKADKALVEGWKGAVDKLSPEIRAALDAASQKAQSVLVRAHIDSLLKKH